MNEDVEDAKAREVIASLDSMARHLSAVEVEQPDLVDLIRRSRARCGTPHSDGSIVPAEAGMEAL